MCACVRGARRTVGWAVGVSVGGHVFSQPDPALDLHHGPASAPVGMQRRRVWGGRGAQTAQAPPAVALHLHFCGIGHELARELAEILVPRLRTLSLKLSC